MSAANFCHADLHSGWMDLLSRIFIEMDVGASGMKFGFVVDGGFRCLDGWGFMCWCGL